MEQDIVCASCGTRLIGTGDITLKCPNCGEVTLGRCRNCRDQSVLYVCPGCGHEGP